MVVVFEKAPRMDMKAELTQFSPWLWFKARGRVNSEWCSGLRGP